MPFRQKQGCQLRGPLALQLVWSPKQLLLQLTAGVPETVAEILRRPADQQCFHHAGVLALEIQVWKFRHVLSYHDRARARFWNENAYGFGGEVLVQYLYRIL